ncbi:hypothetical protein C8R44DRAFT_865311 [Mycena epipterygia]|nr:hypothetical protein C8R44DRAFT_865311 [Mycena epipterygia]
MNESFLLAYANSSLLAGPHTFVCDTTIFRTNFDFLCIMLLTFGAGRMIQILLLDGLNCSLIDNRNDLKHGCDIDVQCPDLRSTHNLYRGHSRGHRRWCCTPRGIAPRLSVALAGVKERLDEALGMRASSYVAGPRRDNADGGDQLRFLNEPVYCVEETADGNSSGQNLGL